MRYVISKKEKELQKQFDQIKKDLLEEKKNRKVACGNCSKLMRIGALDITDVYGYIRPSGCTGGDYWTHGYYEFKCPHCKGMYRLGKMSFEYKEEDGEMYLRQELYKWIHLNSHHAKSYKIENRESKW